MTFEEELHRFWKPYSEADRKRVEEVPGYQGAIERKDIATAQEIACQFLVNQKRSRQPRWLKNLTKAQQKEADEKRAKTPASKALARIVAEVMKDRRRFGLDQQNICLRRFRELRKAHPEFDEEINERSAEMGNRPAFDKDLAKARLMIQGEGKPSAWVKEIAEQVEILKKLETAELGKGRQ